MISEKQVELILNHVSELQERYEGLSLLRTDPDTFIVKGKLAFNAQYNGVSIEDEYEVEIIIPQDYPAIPPTVKEVGGKIPKDFHHYPDDTLCLGAPLEVKKKFHEQRSLLGFVENLLTHFLYGYNFKERYGEMPFGELPHGAEGILTYYRELFDVDNDHAVLGFLTILADDDYRGHIMCPCGSNIKLRNCHGKLILELKGFQKQRNYLVECCCVIKFHAAKKPKYFRYVNPKGNP